VKSALLLAAAEDNDEDDNDYLIDLTTLGRLSMMFVSRSTMDSMHFHFRDSNIFRSGFLGYGPHPGNGWTLHVTDWLLFMLLAKDVLRLDKISTTDTLSTVPKMKEELPIESLVNLTMFNASPMNLKRASQWDLRGSMLKPSLVFISSDGYGCIDRALNMNAENLFLSVQVHNFADISKLIVPKPSRTLADRIKNFFMRCITAISKLIVPKPIGLITERTVRVCYSIDSLLPGTITFPHEHLRALADYIFTRYTNLEYLDIVMEFDLSLPDNIFEPFVQWIKTLNEELKSGPLMSCETHKCDLIFEARFPIQTLTNVIASEHDVTKLGEDCSNAEWTIARRVKMGENFVARYIFIGVD